MSLAELWCGRVAQQLAIREVAEAWHVDIRIAAVASYFVEAMIVNLLVVLPKFKLHYEPELDITTWLASERPGDNMPPYLAFGLASCHRPYGLVGRIVRALGVLLIQQRWPFRLQ